MEFGVFLAPEDPNDLVDQAQQAESVGFDFVGIGDSQSIFRELYTTIGIIARETETVRVGPAVTNAITRHPVVTASAICTVDEISDGRAVLGFGSGDSAVYTLGERPSRLAEMEEFIEDMHSLFAANPVDYEDNEVRLKWLTREKQTRDIPVFLGAEGPKTLNLAGRVADGVFIGTGLFPELIEDSIEKVEEGAREAGRDPDDIEKWILAKANVMQDGEAAVDEIKMALAASANHAFRFTLDGKQVPDEHRDAIKELQEEYVPHEHEELGETKNRELVEDLGLTEYLADRFAVVGTPKQCIQKLSEIRSVSSVDGVLLTAYTNDRERFIDLFGTEVIPEV